MVSLLGAGQLRLGNDLGGDILVSDLRLTTVDCSYIQRDSDARTSRVIEFVPNKAGNIHKFAFTCPICLRRFPKRSAPNFESASNSIRATKPSLLFFDRVGPNILRLVKEARKHGALIMFEPDSLKSGKYFDQALENSDIIKYSRQQAGQSIISIFNEISPKPRIFIETLDGDGLKYLITSNGRTDLVWKYQKPFQTPIPVDRAGAGDWCSAGFIARLLSNKAENRWYERTVYRALRLGQALAAASIMFKGPRGYLEIASSQQVLQTALSTLRYGRVPEWILRDKKENSKSDSIFEDPSICPLCLVPLP